MHVSWWIGVKVLESHRERKNFEKILRANEKCRTGEKTRVKPQQPKVRRKKFWRVSATYLCLKQQCELQNFGLQFSVYWNLTLVKCKKCGGNVQFQTESTWKLDFKILVLCEDCQPTAIFCCPKIGSAYEINRRFTFAIRCLGHRLSGKRKFCGLMDFPLPVVQLTHDKVNKNLHSI